MIVAEGAIDRQGKAISAGYVKKVLEGHGHDTRITILGHVQRGGTPSAVDRVAVSFLYIEHFSAILSYVVGAIIIIF